MVSPVETYKAARAAGADTAAACGAVLQAHPEVSFDAVVDLSWRVEKGIATPDWARGDGTQPAAGSAAARAYARCGEED